MIDDLLIVARFVQFGSVMLLFGASLFPFYAGAPVSTPRGAVTAALLALGSAVAWLLLEAPLMSGVATAYADPPILASVLHQTQFGHIWQWRLIVLCFLTIAIAARRVTLVMVLAGIAVATLAGVGHGAMGVGSDAWLHLGNQAVHMLAASIWVGGLAALLMLIRTSPDAVVMAQALRRFSTVGLGAVLIILASGLVNSWFLVGTMQALTCSPYGHVLMVKLGFFAAMLALALYNRLILLPRLAYDPSLRALTRSIVAEQGCALLVVAAVSILGTMEPAFGMRM